MTHPFDEITADLMCAGGSVKWSTPGSWGDRPYIGAFVAEMDFPLAEPVARSLRVCAETSTLGYLADSWVAGMGEAFAAFWAARFGWAVDPARVRPVADVVSAFAATIEHFTPPDSPVVVPTPAYMPFLRVPGWLGREAVQVPMVRDGDRVVLDLDGIDRALAAGAGLLALVNPNNPTGRVFTGAELAAVTEVVDAHGARVFADEIHAPLVFDGHVHRPYAATSPTAAAHTVTSTSASKAWNMPGLKCAQLVLSNDADAARWSEVGVLAEHGASTPGVRAAIAAYRDGGPWLDDVLAYLDGNRALLAGADLPGLDVTVPDGTYLAWLDARGLAPLLGDEPPVEFFRRAAGVVLSDGARCGTAGAGGMRLVLATGRPVLAEALERMHDALATLGA